MRYERRRILYAAVMSLAASLYLAAQAPTHPLDALTSQEYWTVYEVLKASGRMDSDIAYASVLLRAPAKDQVLAWRTGEPIPREATAILARNGRVIEARVDIAARRLVSWEEIEGALSPMLPGEFGAMGALIKQHPQVREALARRGIDDLDMVQCTALPLGYFAAPDQEGRRIMNGNCSYVRGVNHSWGRSIEGLNIELDSIEKRVLRVVDSGPVPISSASNNFEEAPAIARPGTTPLTVTQSLGPGFAISGGEVSWQNWRFRVRLDPRVGPVVNLVRFDDGGNLRSILYEGSLSELFVPYMDAADGWATRMFTDAGAFFPGGILKKLREGIDCPPNAAYLDGAFPDAQGTPVLRPHLACLYEFSSGAPAWRHFEGNEVWGRPSRTLVLRSAAAIGNYDYLLDWRFEQDGSIRAAVGATGIIETKGVPDRRAHESHTPEDEYGHLVAENLVGVNHDHFFSFRLDLDVDGQNNAFVAHRLKQKQLPASTRRRSIWVAEPFRARIERDAMIDVRLDQPSMWIFENPNARSALGHPTAYELMPGVTAASLLDPEDGAQRVGAFSAHQLWVTPYRRDEMYASGDYPTGSKGAAGLAVWTQANRPIENTDIVAWYTVGFHHMPRVEDWPVMPVVWHDFVIRPYGFFPQNPVLTLPMTP